ARDHYARHGKGFIGIGMDDIMVEIPGEQNPVPAVVITRIIEGMAAEKAGLKVGEVVVGIDGKRWPAPATEPMRKQVMDLKPMTKIEMQILRDGKIENVEVTLVRRPLEADNLMLERMPGRARKAEQDRWEKFFREWKQEHDPKA
ncbi:MAG: PDZ domain-containing protein, partial [Akkermansiaceae bacterium]|nr:PDZ domain-containing protein [Akkermansiaceae bacterium]